MSDPLLREHRDGVLVLSLNRPEKHNAFDDELYDALDDATHAAVEDDDVRVIVLRGQGPSFSSGRDTTALGNHGDGGRLAFVRRAQRVNHRLVASRKPVIAALKGYVLGKALEIALAADIRVVAEGAKLGFPEIRFGLITDNGGASQAAILAGAGRAKYLLMTGEVVLAEQAVAWGLAELLVPPAELDERVLAIACSIAAHAPLAVGFAKEVVNALMEAGVGSGMRTELLAELALFSTEDYQEARRARRDGRAPVFRGR